MILFGGFVKTWGLDNTLTLEHYAKAFSFSFENGAFAWTGVAWNSFWTTMKIALISAPLTAVVGLLTAYLIVRQRFVGRERLRIRTDDELCHSRHRHRHQLHHGLQPAAAGDDRHGTDPRRLLRLPQHAGRRARRRRCDEPARQEPRRGITDAKGRQASEPSARSSCRFLRPAIIAALVYSFVRAITSISAVIFLVSAEYNMATAYIVGLVENGEYGVAIAYSSMLIVVMIAIIAGFQLLVGERRLRRENRVATASPHLLHLAGENRMMTKNPKPVRSSSRTSKKQFGAFTAIQDLSLDYRAAVRS